MSNTLHLLTSDKVRKVTLLIIGILLSLFIGTVSVSAASGKDSCVVNTDIPDEKPTCFYTLGAALNHATNGEVDTNQFSTRQNVLSTLEAYDSELMSGESQSSDVVYAIVYDKNNHSGSSLVLTSANNCTYGTKTIGDFSAYGWDDEPRSADLYAYCDSHEMWENAWWGGVHGTFGKNPTTYSVLDGNISSAEFFD
jgi:hypothetical protein